MNSTNVGSKSTLLRHDFECIQHELSRLKRWEHPTACRPPKNNSKHSICFLNATRNSVPALSTVRPSAGSEGRQPPGKNGNSLREYTHAWPCIRNFNSYDFISAGSAGQQPAVGTLGACKTFGRDKYSRIPIYIWLHQCIYSYI